jgi:hypothetical protein
MGGMLAYDVAARTGLASAVVATNLLDASRPEVLQGLTRYRWQAVLLPLVLRTLRPVVDSVPVRARWISRMDAIANNPRVASVIGRDPLSGGGWMPGRFWRTYLQAPRPVPPEAFTDIPVVLAHPAVDRMSDIALSRPFFNRLAGPKRLVMLDGAGRAPLEQPGFAQLWDVLRETLAAVCVSPGRSGAADAEL